MNIKEIDALLKASLPLERYEHSVRVMYDAAVLAEHYGLDEKKARLAGLLHDCGRENNKNETALAREMGLDVSPLETAQPVLLHARTGQVIAREKYKVADPDVLRAIGFHTTGSSEMTGLDMVIFLSDYTEPARTQKGVDKARSLLRKSLKMATLEVVRQNVDFLLSHGRGIHPDCIGCWNWLLFKSTRQRRA